ncbi:Delta(14)-sterol reductase; AltName: Full=C-14 sterol reductase; AltName: Full=Sterol C14-reductase [Serendipita indica DSM 11827]|nr:Delta(14)-sterol reductase; AltName: Full=C-14 sterol reductase; AltName: Full=Sterol C14-reductase [Serendipita indica DSM 11827]
MIRKSAHKSTKDPASALNPRTTSYEFFGPPGALVVSIVAPLLTFGLSYGCSEKAGGCPGSWLQLPSDFAHAVADPEWWKAQWDPQGFVAYFAWYAFVVIAWAILPGEWVEGLPLRTGERLQYKINALSTLFLTLGAVGGLIWMQALAPSHIFMIIGSVFSPEHYATYCYLVSFRPGALLALGGNTGVHNYDWFIGRELNPRIGWLDLKSFNELRPGMMFWLLINVSMACKQAVRRGGRITDSMWLVILFEGFYVVDALYHETALFSTMDIISDGFGFMLSFGDLMWVPFIYSLQARYLAWHPVELGPLWTTVIFALHGLGYYIFRSSNSEKNQFRNGKNPKNRTFMQTKRGTKLLTSGWWGMSRHPNYFGDLILALSWCLPTGFGTPVTYFYFIWFTLLLVHRQRRDDEACHLKYGDDWNEYKKLVPWRIVPGVY